MSGISFMGVGSGIPVNDIIQATVDAEAAPLARLENDKQFYQSQISGLGQLKSRLTSMADAMKDLRGQENFQQLAAKSGNESLFTATADHIAGATAGNYNIEVLAEAKNYRHVSTSMNKTATNNFTGTLTFKDKDGNALVDSGGTEISIDTTGKTLDEIRAEINSNTDLQGKVSANLVNTSDTEARLVLNAVESGEAGRFKAIFSDDPTDSKKDAGLSSDASSLDARIKIDGIEATSSTNTFDNVISGVTINVAQGAMNETSQVSTLEVKRDDAAIKDSINAFIKTYNDVVIHLNEAKKGSLYGDSTIRSIEAELRNALYTPTTSSLDPSDPDYDNDTQKNYLATLGIEIYSSTSYDPENPDSQNGTLRIDSAKLDEILENDFDRVAHVIGASDYKDNGGIDGYAERFADLATRLVSGGVRDGVSYKGLIQIRTEGLNQTVSRIDDKVESTNLRLELLEERLIKQFSAIDSIVANFNSTGSFISQQMAGLPGYTK